MTLWRGPKKPDLGGCERRQGSNLMQAFAGTQQAHHRWSPWHGGEYAQAAHQPHVLQITILLREEKTRGQRAARNTSQTQP